MRARIAALIGLLVVVVVVIAIGGYWYVKDRTRISQASLQTKVAATEGGSQATCVKKDSNAAHWLCAVTIRRQPEKCVKAHVRPWGSVSVVDGYRKCLSDPALAALFQHAKKKQKQKQKKKKHQSSA
jgi:uncharacterized membrane protein